MNKEILLNGRKVEIAEYKEQIIDEYDNNPFIQALPYIKSKEEIIKLLNSKIKFTKKEADLDSNIRIHILQKIYKVFQPLPIHLRVWNMIDTLLRQGYVSRNPYNPEYIRHINKTGNNIINKNYTFEVKSSFTATASCGLIIGFSGMGKTTIVNKVLENIPQVIAHNNYNGQTFNNIQVTWIKLEAPHNSSLKALTLQFFMKVDEILGTNNMRRYAVKNLSVDAMLPLLGQLANNIGLGLLVIDELQHLNKNSSQVMNYFVTLMNTFGVPILLIGTPACYDMLQQEMRIARRVTGSGEIIWNNMKNDDEFKLFLKGIWRYQYLKKYTKLNDEIINIIYLKTQGISDLVVKLFVKVQQVCIETGKEEITVDLINKVWNKEFKMITPMIESIKSNNKTKMFKYEDIKILAEESLDNKLISKKKAELNDNNDNNNNNSNSNNGNSTQYKSIKKKIKVDNLDDNDIRKIVIVGLKNSKSTYESLKENGVIKNIYDVIGGKND